MPDGFSLPMKKITQIRLRHILESMTVSCLAGALVSLSMNLWGSGFERVAEWLAGLGLAWICGLTLGGFVIAGVLFPRAIISSVRGIRYFPCHCGLVVKVFFGGVVCLLINAKLAEVGSGRIIDVVTISWVGGICAGGLWLAYRVALLFMSEPKEEKETTAICSDGEELEAWLGDDRPIETEAENRIPRHAGVARRVLNRLFSETNGGSSALPSIAVIGPYGSGKTSVCNMVRTIYMQEKESHPEWPVAFFCRFEAWQFLTPEACVKGLMGEIAKTVLSKVDASELWKMPEKYLEAVKAVGNPWASFLASLGGAGSSPDDVADRLGNALIRINARLVIFVDDFDRIEEEGFTSQQALAKAMNLLQSLAHTQYVVAVGPVAPREGKAGDCRPCRDLLKLTRFQELIPKVEPEVMVKLARDLRDRNVEDRQYRYLFLETDGDRSDPLVYESFLWRLYASTGVPSALGCLIELISSPRVLKSTLRETHRAWEDGLRGEINWHHLLLANALKAAEPGVFEWIMREPDVFLEVPGSFSGSGDAGSEEARMYAEQLRERLVKCIGHSSKKREDAVISAIGILFPEFRSAVNMATSLTRSHVHAWSQELACGGYSGRDYFNRFVAGRVAEDELKDQPTLQYMRKIMDKGYDRAEFEEKYLASFEKVSGSLEKFVQFAGLISEEIAYLICDTMLEWMCDRQHWRVSDQEDNYLSNLMGAVKNIIDRSGQYERAQARNEARRGRKQAINRDEWVQGHLEELARRDAIVAIEYGKCVAGELLGEAETRALLGRIFKEELLAKQESFWSQVQWQKSYMRILLWALEGNDDYESIRNLITESLLKKANADKSGFFAESIVMSLVHFACSAARPDLIETYSFSVNKEENERTFNMEILLPVVSEWNGQQFKDQVAAKAFEHLTRAYADEINSFRAG